MEDTVAQQGTDGAAEPEVVFISVPDNEPTPDVVPIDLRGVDLDQHVEEPHDETDVGHGREGGEDGDGGPLDLSDDVASMGHADLARKDLGDDDAYGSRHDVSWMRTEKARVDLRVEETLVINALRR